ncbi:MAG TPA: hypothetical protein VH913_18810 [Hyphomicrobiaceae bacterium]|jgi:hypothetical protein
MATREEFLAHLWTDVIDPHCREQGLDNIVANCKRRPNDAFGDVGAAIERMLAAGASRSDLCRLLRLTAYEAVFGTLYALSDPGLDGEEDAGTLYEELLMADPSGVDGRST